MDIQLAQFKANLLRLNREELLAIFYMNYVKEMRRALGTQKSPKLNSGYRQGLSLGGPEAGGEICHVTYF